MSFVALGTSVLEDGEPLVVITDATPFGTYSAPLEQADLERCALELEQAEERVALCARLDARYWPPVTPFIGRVEHGNLVAIRRPACMTDEGFDWLTSIALRDGLPLDETDVSA